jgi:hypothetical protein
MSEDDANAYKSDPLYETVLNSLQRIANAVITDRKIGHNFPYAFSRAEYTEFYLLSRVTEAQVQGSIIEMLGTWRIDVVAIDAGLRRARGRMIAHALERGQDVRSVAALSMGVEIPAGYVDLNGTLAPDGKGFFIEVKAPAWIDPSTKKIIREAGKATEEQLAFLDSKDERGAIAMVAWSVDDVVKIMGNRLQLNLDSLRAK